MVNRSTLITKNVSVTLQMIFFFIIRVDSKFHEVMLGINIRISRERIYTEYLVI